MKQKYLTIEEAGKRGCKSEFLRNVRIAVIPRMIEKGLLHGTQEKGRKMVADDAAFGRIMSLGIEAFVQDQQGYSFVAVRAPIERVSQHLQRRPGIAQYAENVKPQKIREGDEVRPDKRIRHAFLVQMEAASEWSLLIQTVHWFQKCDAVMGTALASVFSKEFQSIAVAAWDDDFSGSSAIVCENGNQKGCFSDNEEGGGWGAFFEFFYIQGIYLPECFIATQDGNPSLHVAQPGRVLRADYAKFLVPSLIEGMGTDVLGKSDMMNKAHAEGSEDEHEFVKHMRDEVWSQAQVLLNAGQF